MGREGESATYVPRNPTSGAAAKCGYWEEQAHEGTTLKWAAELAKAGVLTGDEYRELSPLGLNIGDFPDPVSGASQAEQRTEQQMEAAMGRVMERTQARALDAALLHRMAGLPDQSIDKQMLDVMQGLDKAIAALAPSTLERHVVNGNHR